uniref:pentapeptide repeat-containing protein n=1 Tax=Petrachloros mirabilis TaxID=2918835 RepID=UPI0030846208
MKQIRKPGGCQGGRSLQTGTWRQEGLRLCLLLVLLVGLWVSGSSRVWAASGDNSSSRLPLTLELLQERLRSPLTVEGSAVLDLSHLIVDLRPENADFRDQFYRLVQASLQQPSQPLGLDISDSIIQGELLGQKLGLRAPLYGESLSALFSESEAAQLDRDRQRQQQLSRLSQALFNPSGILPQMPLTVFRGRLRLQKTQFLGRVDFGNTFFLSGLDATGARFAQDGDWSQIRSSKAATFAESTFVEDANFRGSVFFEAANFSQVAFRGEALFQASEFQGTASFQHSNFEELANFSRTLWSDEADFAQVRWQQKATFETAAFQKQLNLMEALWLSTGTFRQATFALPVNLRGASLRSQLDFSDTRFGAEAYLNVAGLQFDPNSARLLGDPGRIGQALSVPTLAGNEILLRNLVRNFRQLEQIGDANQVQYLTESLRLRSLLQRLFNLNLNTASQERLRIVGFSAEQATAVVAARQVQPFRNLTDLIIRDLVDLDTYIDVRDRIAASPPLNLGNRILLALRVMGMALLLVLSHFGSSFWLILGVGLVAMAYFGLVFWIVDRFRRLHPQPIMPPQAEIITMLGIFAGIEFAGGLAILRSSEMPLLTLGVVTLLVVPIPLTLMGILYRRGRYHDLMNVSYFVEDGSLRQLRLLIARLPIMPKFPFYRDRYTPILWDRRWGWINYFDLSLNNWFKFGFNDIRLRDEHLPGLISSLVWYQWGLGLLYIALLLWTLSRTIPGLNLFIYF